MNHEHHQKPHINHYLIREKGEEDFQVTFCLQLCWANKYLSTVLPYLFGGSDTGQLQAVEFTGKVESSQVLLKFPTTKLHNGQCPAKQSTPPAHPPCRTSSSSDEDGENFLHPDSSSTPGQVSILVPSSRLSRRNPTLLTSSSPHPANEQRRRGLATRNMRDDYSK